MLPVVADERSRLQQLAQYRVVETAPEPQFDHIVQLAAALFDVPMAAISFVDAHRVWFKAKVGIEACAVSRDVAFCSRALERSAPLIVPDLAQDTRFASNPLVFGAPTIRFYAGAPLIAATGDRLGTLCIMDQKPRFGLTDELTAQLVKLASLVVDHLELRRADFVNAVARGVTDATQDAILCIDPLGKITFANRAALDMFGYAASEMTGQTLDLIMPERFRSAHASGVARIAAGSASRLNGKSVELSALRRSGEEFPVEISICSWRDGHGVHMGASLRDISDRKQRDLRLHRLAHHDPLTGLANKLQLESALKETCDAEVPVALLLLDLDNFKRTNEGLGHAAGDALLQTLAIRLQGAIDAATTLARMGGDEFAVMLKSGDPLAAQAGAEAILAAFEEPVVLMGHRVHVGVSIGGAVGPGHGRDAEELIASADLALCRAKADGGARFRLYEPVMRSAVAARRALQDELIRAFEQREFVLHYQPQLCLHTRQLIGAEALLRWQHPRRGLLHPGAFMAALENHALALDVGTWVLDEACRALAALRRDGLRMRHIAVNLFAAQLDSGTLVDTVLAALDRHGLRPADLELEITETIALQNDERVFGLLRALRSSGVGLAFDDFGTGFASLSTLKRVPLTTLKIDRSFVQGMVDDEQDAAVVAALVGMGRRLGLDVVAEGIETAEQEAHLAELGCPIVQGFRYGPGMMADALRRQWSAAGAEGTGRCTTVVA